MIKIRVEIKDNENRKSIKPKAGYLKISNKIDKSLARPNKKERRQINIRNEEGPSVPNPRMLKG